MVYLKGIRSKYIYTVKGELALYCIDIHTCLPVQYCIMQSETVCSVLYANINHGHTSFSLILSYCYFKLWTQTETDYIGYQ